MLDSGQVDAVVTTVPHYLHPEMASTPSTTASTCSWRSRSASYTRQARQAARHGGRAPRADHGDHVQPAHQPAVQDLRELVAGGTLGRLRHTSWIITTWWRPQGYYDQSALARHLGRRGRRRPRQPGAPPARPVAVDLWRADVGVREARLRLPARHRRRGRGDGCRRLRRGRDRHVHHLHPRPAGTDRLEILLDQGKIVVDDSRTGHRDAAERPRARAQRAHGHDRRDAHLRRQSDISD